MRNVRRWSMVAMIAVLGAACGKGAGSYPDSVEGLERLVVDLRAGKADPKGLALPDARGWYAELFGDAAAADRLVAELQHPRRKVEDLPKALKDMEKAGRSQITVERFTEADDPNANGVQSFALRSAKKPVALYSVRLTPPGKPLGTHIYSFVYVDGGFRFAGPMKTLKGEPASAEVEAVAELRNKDREEYFRSGKLPGDE
jgi:hypothetical protein